MKNKLICTICSKELKGKQTLFCSTNCKNKQHQSYLSQKKRGIVRKLQFINQSGGKCAICGYNKNISALIFHHLDPKEKDFKLDVRSLSNRTNDKNNQELSKCILLCSNCHAEVHNPELNLDSLSSSRLL